MVQVQDIDLDGHPDLLAPSDAARRIEWYGNTNGMGTVWVTHIVATAMTGVVSVAAGDYDGDADIDVASGSALNSCTVDWHENMDQLGTSWSQHQVSAAFLSPYSIASLDVDGDTDLDIVASGFYNASITLFRNILNASSWNEELLTLTAYGTLSVDGSDLDGDGDQDILYSARDDGTVEWLENLNGSGQAWQNHVITSNAPNIIWATTADLDGDEDLDLVSTGLRWRRIRQLARERRCRCHGNRSTGDSS